jgi:alpha-galactosidase
MQILDKQEGLRAYAGPGHWNDPDMLEVGNGGMSFTENRAHFAMWCMLAAPLIAGNDLRTISNDVKSILTAKELIAINQDSLGIQGLKYSTKDSVETWFKPLKNGDWAVFFLNRSRSERKIRFDWANNKVEDSVAKRTFDAAATSYTLKNLWTGKENGTTKEPLQASLAAHDVLTIRLIKKIK